MDSSGPTVCYVNNWHSGKHWRTANAFVISNISVVCLQSLWVVGFQGAESNNQLGSFLQIRSKMEWKCSTILISIRLVISYMPTFWTSFFNWSNKWKLTFLYNFYQCLFWNNNVKYSCILQSNWLLTKSCQKLKYSNTFLLIQETDWRLNDIKGSWLMMWTSSCSHFTLLIFVHCPMRAICLGVYIFAFWEALHQAYGS